MSNDPPTFSVAQIACIKKANNIATVSAAANTASRILSAHADPVVQEAMSKLMPVIAEWAKANKPTFEREVIQAEAVLTGEPGAAFYAGNSADEDLPLPGETKHVRGPHIAFELGDTGWLMRAAMPVLVNGDRTKEVEVVDGDVVRVGHTEITVRIPGPE